MEMLKLWVDWKDRGQAGAAYAQKTANANLAVHSALRRGWFFGSKELRRDAIETRRGDAGETL